MSRCRRRRVVAVAATHRRDTHRRRRAQHSNFSFLMRATRVFYKSIFGQNAASLGQ